MIDAHTHLGLDEDGRSLTLEQLLAPARRARARAGRACSRCTTPSATPPTRVPNDRVLGVGGRKRRAAGALLPPGPRRRPAGRGRALPGGGRARDQAAPPRAGLRVRRRGDGRRLRAGRRGARADPDPRRARPAAARRRARRPRAAPPRRGADPRPRRDLRPGHPHLAPGRPPGRAVRHLLLLPARRDRAVRARARPSGSCSPPTRPTGMPATTLYMALRVAAQAGLDEADDEADARRHDGRRCSTATALPPVDAPRGAAPRSRSPGASRACTATRASSARRCSPARSSRRAAMLDMAIAACRDPEPGDVRRGAGDDRRGAERGRDALLAERGRRAPGDRPRLPRDRARRDRDPRRRLSRTSTHGARRSHTRGPLAALRAARARAGRGARRTPRRPRRPPRAAARPAIRCAGRAGASCARARAAAGAAGWRARRRPRRRARPRPSHGSVCARRSKRRTSSVDAVDGGVLRARPRRSRARCRAPSTGAKPSLRGGDREHPRAGADVEQRRRPARSLRGQLEQQLQAQARGGVRAGAERLPGVDHDLLARCRAGRALGGLPRRAHAQRGHAGAPPRRAAAPRSGPAGGSASSAPASRRRSRWSRSRRARRPRRRRRSGRLGSSPGAP